MNVFDYVKSINTHQYQEDLSAYNPFIINRSLSFGIDTILYANEVNLYPQLDHLQQYDYLFYSIRPKKRFNPWIKGKENFDDINLVKEYFGYNTTKARQALSILDSTALENIKKELQKGGRE